MIPSPFDFEIIDAHTHPFLDRRTGSIGNYGKPDDMDEFDRVMKKVGIDKYSGSPLVLHHVSDFSEIPDSFQKAFICSAFLEEQVSSANVSSMMPSLYMDEHASKYILNISLELVLNLL